MFGTIIISSEELIGKTICFSLENVDLSTLPVREQMKLRLLRKKTEGSKYVRIISKDNFDNIWILKESSKNWGFFSEKQFMIVEKIDL